MGLPAGAQESWFGPPEEGTCRSGDWVHLCSSCPQIQVTVPRDMAHMGRTAPGRGGCAGQAPGLQARRVQDGQVSGAYLYPVFGGHGGGKHGLITAALSGPRSSSASPRPCLPQRMPWRSGGRAWVRERPHLSRPSGVCSGERRGITAFGPFLQEGRLTHTQLPSLPAPALPLGANSQHAHAFLCPLPLSFTILPSLIYPLAQQLLGPLPQSVAICFYHNCCSRSRESSSRERAPLLGCWTNEETE